MNRGHGRERIFAREKDKTIFLNMLGLVSKRLKIRILAYCLMDNHYHMVIENSSGRIADYFKLLNGEYGIYYRRRHGGSGYVFQGRFSHTIVTPDGFCYSQSC